MSEPEKSTVETTEVRVRGSRQKVLLDPDDLVRTQVGGFVTFLREHAVVGVAIGFIIGLQAQTLVKQLVTSFITPIMTLIVGPHLINKAWVINGSRHVAFEWGQFVYSLADFLSVLLFIYLIVKFFKLDKFDKPTVGTIASPPTIVTVPKKK